MYTVKIKISIKLKIITKINLSFIGNYPGKKIRK